jgi:hypothetical protein
MNIKRQSKLKMYLTLRIFLLSNPAITAKLPNYPEFIAALDAAIMQIQNSSEKHYNSKGVTDNKSLLREGLITATIDASAKIQAYAKYTQDTVLLAETKFTTSALKIKSALELLDDANGLYNRIDDHIADLTTYGLTVDTQKDYRVAIDDFSESIPQPRQSQLKSKENTLLEDQGFEAADEAVDNIDSVVEIVKLTEVLFYSGYKNARKIVDQGSGTLQVKGNITEAVTGKPIPVATVTFRLSGQTDVAMEKETAAKGGFMIKTLAEGIYDVTVTKVGFQTKTISIAVRWDELCNVEVALEKL